MVEVTFISLKFLLCAKDYEKFTLGKVGKCNAQARHFANPIGQESVNITLATQKYILEIARF